MTRLNLICVIVSLLCLAATMRVVVREIRAIEARIQYQELRHEPIIK